MCLGSRDSCRHRNGDSEARSLENPSQPIEGILGIVELGPCSKRLAPFRVIPMCI
jgi:hypothetical protein